jgi:hypothetical protein
LVEAAHSHPLLEALSAVLRLAPRGRLLLRDLLVEIGTAGRKRARLIATDSNREQMPAAPDRPRAASLHARPWQDDVARTALRDALRQHLDAGTITRPELAKALGIKRNSLSGHLGRRVPGSAVQAQVRRWLEKTAAANNAAAASPTTMLSRQEQDRLLGYLSSGGNRRELKEQFGTDRDTLERAAAGETLAEDVVAELRRGLDSKAAASP